VNRRGQIFMGLTLLAVLAPFLGKGGWVVAIILGGALFGVPLFALIGILTVACFFLFSGYVDVREYTRLIERIRSLADQDVLLAIPLFIMSGAVMSRGQISVRLVDFAKALVGWLPGGLAVSGVLACMLFAAISGSSPATVVAIGSMMGPTLIAQGYSERFSHGLLTSAGSLGILIPPSIPMILYPIVNQSAVIPVETLFAAGIGPGIIVGVILMGFCVYYGLTSDAKREPFTVDNLLRATIDGFWALLFPVIILGGIYGGIFYAVEAAAVSVVYAVLVEVYIHRAMTLGDVPKVFQETGVFLGSLLVIMVAALSFNEFLEVQQVPQAAVAWIRSLELTPLSFLLILNLLLLVVGTLMDILSAMFVFVPLLAPIAMSMGVDPMHFGIIFIVNLEIGYLTPPVGLNLFVASTLYQRSLGHMVRAVVPFVGLMMVGLAIVTYVPAVSVGLGYWIRGEEAPPPPEITAPSALGGDDGMLDDDEVEDDAPAGVMTMEEMMREAADGEDGDEDDGRVMSMEEMMRQAAEGAVEEEEEGPAADDGRVMTMEEMMRLAEEEAAD
jgi:C4-dicarboxylate transporter DctM subunit